MKRIAAILLLLPLLLCGGCSGLQLGADPVVVNAERTLQVARATLDAFVRFEFHNRAQCPPEVQAAAEKIRRDAPEWFARVVRLKQSYKLNRGADQKADLLTAVSVLSTAASEAATALAKHQH
tara:strand:- start:1962 stop:2330 length:369 start_codon:yes stop_codon:yes gene_type:complete